MLRSYRSNMENGKTFKSCWLRGRDYTESDYHGWITKQSRERPPVS
jgi:hypothetical protein